jgi:hypothetical protein
MLAPTPQPVYGAEQWVNGIVGGTPIEGGITESWQLNGGLERFNQEQAGLQAEMTYDAANPSPELKLVQGADGNWTNANADANQAWMKQKLETLHPQTDTTQYQTAQPAAFWGNAQPTAQTGQQTPPQPYPVPVSIPAPVAPQMKLMQDAQGNWYNANAAATQEYAAQQIVKEAPKADPTSEFWKIANGTAPQVTDVPSTPNESDLAQIAQYKQGIMSGLQQDAQGNWFNPAAGPASSNPNQSAIDQWLAAHPNGPQTDADYAAFNALNGVVTEVPLERTPLPTMLPDGTPRVDLRQDAQGNWYNANADQAKSYMTDLLKSDPNASDPNWVTKWQEGVANGTIDPWAGYKRVSWAEFAKGANWSGTTADQRLSLGAGTPADNAAQNLSDFNKYYEAMSGSGSGGDNAHAEAAAAKYAMQGLASFVKNPSAANYTADQLQPMLRMLYDAIPYTTYTTSDGYQKSLDKFYGDLGTAFGFDYAGSIGRNKTAQGALTELASYLSNPANAKKVNTGVLGQLANQAVQGANAHIGRAMQGDMKYNTNPRNVAAYANNYGLYNLGYDSQDVATLLNNQYLDNFGSTMPT